MKLVECFGMWLLDSLDFDFALLVALLDGFEPLGVGLTGFLDWQYRVGFGGKDFWESGFAFLVLGNNRVVAVLWCLHGIVVGVAFDLEILSAFAIGICCCWVLFLNVLIGYISYTSLIVILIVIFHTFLKVSCLRIWLLQLPLKNLIHLFLVYDVLLFLLRVLICQYNLNYLHAVILNLLKTSLCFLVCFSPVLVFLSDDLVAVLELVLLEIVLEIRQEPCAILGELRKNLWNLHVDQHVAEFSDFLLAQSILMNQWLCEIHQPHHLLINLLLQHLNLSLVLLNQLEFLHRIDSLIDVLSQLFKRTFQ